MFYLLILLLDAMEAESNREEDWEESLELDSSEDDLSGSETDNSIEEPDTSNLGVFAAEEEKDNLSHVDIKVRFCRRKNRLQ